MIQFLKKLVPHGLKNFLVNNLPNNLLNKFRPKLSTSLSDNNFYPDFCNKASLDKKIFSNFRRNSVYKEILEHVTYDLGKEYYNEISKNYPELLNFVELFRKNDEFGNPEIFDYQNIGKISPTTLRYIKVAGDLIKLFKDLNNLNICEIGVGYGGQCRIITCLSSPKSYTLVDIKPALRLAQSYLDNFSLNTVIKYYTMNELEIKDYDLIISNYAFSELRRDIQDIYLKKIILNSRKGYITFNDVNPDYFNSYKREELLQLIPNSHIIEEKPLTHKNNCIIVWGDSE